MKNITAIRVRFLPVTNTKGARLSITQLNTGKRCIVDYDYRYDNTSEQIEALLPNVVRVVDYTQNDYELYTIEAIDGTFPDYIKQIKEVTK